MFLIISVYSFSGSHTPGQRLYMTSSDSRSVPLDPNIGVERESLSPYRGLDAYTVMSR